MKNQVKKTVYKSHYQLKVKEQTIRMTYRGKEVTPNNFDPTSHNLLTMLGWFKCKDGSWVTVPPKNKAHLTDLNTFTKWVAQWGL